MRNPLVVAGLVLVLAGISFAANVEVKLDDSASKSSFVVMNSVSTGVASFDSLGRIRLGRENLTTGTNSVAMGYSNISSANYSTAIGAFNTASNWYSVALGNGNQAIGYDSIAFGAGNIASGSGATAMGGATQSTANYSVSMGYATVASGESSLALGKNFILPSTAPYSLGIGYNASPGGTPDIVLSPVGSSYFRMDSSDGSSALQVKSLDQNKIISLESSGAITAKGIISSGNPSNLGIGTRMMWYPQKASFRAGGVSNTNWDDANIGNYSVAFGSNTKASGFGSFAAGGSSLAAGDYAVAIGASVSSNADNSMTIGKNIDNNNPYSIAIGYDPSAHGVPDILLSAEGDSYFRNTLLIGKDPSYSSVYGELSHAGGSSGFKINANAGGGWADMHLQTDGTTRLFIESGGNVGIGTTTPGYRLEARYDANNWGYIGDTDTGVFGRAQGTGVRGESLKSNAINYGVIGYAGGAGTATNYGIYGLANNGSTNYAGYFAGTLYCSTLTKGSGSFDITHPDPAKAAKNYRLRHAFVESPTRGDNLYRFAVAVKGGEAIISLPDYFKHLNENVQIWVSPIEHFGGAYGKVDSVLEKITIKADTDGEYNVLAVGTRKDKIAKDFFDAKGVEYIKTEPDPQP